MVRNYVALMALVPSIAFADDGSKVVLASEPFNEVVREAAQISGARLVGLIAVGASSLNLEVAAHIPGDWKDEKICLRVVSADGLYEAYNAYQVAADWPGGRASLPYPSRSPTDVAAIPADHISGIVLRGDCDSRSEEAAPVFWGKADKGSIRLLFNTARADETYLAFPDHPNEGDVTCETIVAPARTAFDTSCTIPDSLRSADRLNAIALSFKNGEMGQEEELVLRLAE